MLMSLPSIGLFQVIECTLTHMTQPLIISLACMYTCMCYYVYSNHAWRSLAASVPACCICVLDLAFVCAHTFLNADTYVCVCVTASCVRVVAPLARAMSGTRDVAESVVCTPTSAFSVSTQNSVHTGFTLTPRHCTDLRSGTQLISVLLRTSDLVGKPTDGRMLRTGTHTHNLYVGCTGVHLLTYT